MPCPGGVRLPDPRKVSLTSLPRTPPAAALRRQGVGVEGLRGWGGPAQGNCGAGRRRRNAPPESRAARRQAGLEAASREARPGGGGCVSALRSDRGNWLGAAVSEWGTDSGDTARDEGPVPLPAAREAGIERSRRDAKIIEV